mgnify:CR=1 FL=1
MTRGEMVEDTDKAPQEIDWVAGTQRAASGCGDSAGINRDLGNWCFRARPATAHLSDLRDTLVAR